MDYFCDLKIEKGIIELSGDVTKNYISIDNVDYFIGYLDPNFPKNKGANSFVLALYDAQSYDETATPVKAIKISKIANEYHKEIVRKNPYNRSFYTEIDVLKDCSERELLNVLRIDTSGHLIIKEMKKAFPFYLMDYAEYDLKKFFEIHELDMSGKLNLCIDIAKGLKELYDLGYYHRDLKPDNIFMFGDVWKIGDLGLVARRDSENNDNSYKIIGPKGWLSPESMNRYLTQEKDRRYDCKIDHQSDVFQLGKIFWFIIQGNVPIGCIKYTDSLLSTKNC